MAQAEPREAEGEPACSQGHPGAVAQRTNPRHYRRFTFFPTPTVSHADYTSNVYTSARMAAGMTSRARRPYIGYSAG
jgi:hypothetical protein